MKTLKEKVIELANIAKECPENLQEKCFELLLLDFFSQQKQIKNNIENEREQKNTEPSQEEKNESKQNNIQEKNIHVKVKKFMEKEGVKLEHINQIFYEENGDLKPLYEDLKTTKSSESQIRIALLTALRNALHSGNFEFNGEDVRKETQIRKCYDGVNFASYFKNNKGLFDNFESYNKNNPSINLSSDGKSRLAEIIKDLQ